MIQQASTLLDQLDENLVDTIQVAKNNGNNIETLSSDFKKLLRAIHEIFSHETIETVSEEAEKKIKELLERVLTKADFVFILEFCKTSFRNLNSREISFSIYVLLLEEKLFSAILQSLLSNDFLREVYRKKAFLMDVDLLVKFIKKMQHFEEQKIKIISKWVDSYHSSKKKHEKPITLTVDEPQIIDLSSSELFKNLAPDDPIRQWLNAKYDTSNIDSGFQSEASFQMNRQSIFMPNKERKYNFSGLNNFYNIEKEKKKDDNKLNSHNALKMVDSSITKNSEKIFKLFVEPYIHIEEFFRKKFETPKPMPEKCFLNGEPLTSGLIFGNAYFCEITGEWFCKACMEPGKRVVPWKVVKSLDFGTYKVSKTGANLLDNHFNEPFMLFGKSFNYEKNAEFSRFVIMRKMIHLMFDTICDTELMLKIFKEKEHLFARELYLSPKNTTEISLLLNFLNSEITKFRVHFDQCPKCEVKKRKCQVCQKRDIFSFDITNTVLCHTCGYLFHSNCFQKGMCTVCLQTGNDF